MTFQRVDALPSPHVPYLGSCVERTGQQAITLRVKGQADYFSCMSIELLDFDASLHVPHRGLLVHGACGHHQPVRVELRAHYLRSSWVQRVEALSANGIPYFCGSVERPSHNFITEWVVERDSLNHILMPF